MIRAALLLLWCLAALPAQAEERIVAGLSQNWVSITADFSGSEILIYGAVKREAPPPKAGPLRVVITVEGPSTPLTVRRKDRRWGIWINNAEVEVDSAPSFYAIATSARLADSLSDIEDLRHQISIPRVIRAIGISAEADASPAFVEAMMRIRQDEGRYTVAEHSVMLTEETLFRADVQLPAALTEGDYRVRVFLTRDGRVIDRLERDIYVRKAGLERFLHRLAFNQPLIYGLLSLLVATVAGWGASALFNRLRW